MTTASRRRLARRLVPAVAGVAVAALALTGCSGGSAGSASGKGATTFTYFGTTENVTTPAVLKSLSTGACSAANKALPYKYDHIAQAQLDQKLQLLAGQNALATQFAAGGAPALTQSLLKSGQLKDLGPELSKLGIEDDILPAAQSSIKALYGGKMDALPYEFNIEGFWYNKKLFADNGLDVPTTWDDLVSDAAVFKKAGLQPFATGASGQGWPVTRLISGYLFRELGPTAMTDIRDGKAKLTDPKYVEAAAQVQKLGKAGYFGKAVGSVDYNTIVSQFLTGKAPMMYMGSWILSNFADKAQNKIGSDDIGFFAFPTVTGGAGSADQLPGNVGLPTGISAKLYNAKVGSWVKCIAKNYGSTALKEKGTISGFRVNTPVKTDPLTTIVQDRIASTTTSVQWFEAFLSSKASTAAWNNVAQMVNGQMSAEQYMSTVQAAQ